MKAAIHKEWLLFAAAMLLFLYGSNLLPFIGPDEPRYSQVARQMLASRDFITPRLGEHPWFEKPVLLYWLMSASFKIFGLGEFAARFPSALAALACVVMIYFTVKRIAGSQRALLSALVLATSVFIAGFAHAATFDMILTACITASLCCFLLFQTGTAGKTALYGMYAFCGAGILAKGFVAPIVIALAVISYLLFRPRNVATQTFLDKVRELKPVTGSLITILVAAIWFLPVTLVHGFRFWDDFFFQHHLMRYTSSRFHRDEGLFFYLPVLLVGLYPWTMAPLLGFRQRLTEKERILIRFALCWLISTVLFFSFSQSKLPGYVLPAAPAFSILAGLALGDCFERNRWKALVILFAIFNAVMAGAIITGAAKFSAPYQPLILMAAIIVAVCAASFFLLRLKKPAAAAAVYSMIAAAGIVIGVHMIAPAMNWYESRSLAYAARCYLINNKKLVVYNIYDFTLVYYSNAHVDLDERGYFINISNYQELYRYLLDKRSALVVAGNEELHWMQRADFLRILSITRGKERSIVYVMLRRRPS